MENEVLNKIAVLEELMSMLFADKFRQFDDPAASALKYADYVQSRMEQASVEGAPEEMKMMMEAEFASFFERVVKRLNR